jgi:ferric-dicitrate binding protein FerR (iron transport regulator)
MAVPDLFTIKYPAGESAPEEASDPNVRREESPDNERVFQEIGEPWNEICDTQEMIIPDKEAVWQKIIAHIQDTKTVETYRRSTMVRIAGIAAMIALIAGFSLSFFGRWNVGTVQTATSEIVVRTPAGQKSEAILPDGTTVWLNSATTLSYSSDYNVRNRHVKLDGEAFFEVTKNKQSEFRVTAGEVHVVVHGTAFNLSAYNDDQAIDVSLLNGHVSVVSADNRLLADLQPDQKASIDRNSLLCRLTNCDAKMESLWKNGQLKITDEPMDAVAKKIERWYGVHIHLPEEIRDEHYWLTVKTESLTETLELIRKITPIQYSISGKEVAIRYR